MIEGIKNTFSLILQDAIHLININPKVKGDPELIELSKKLKRDGIVNLKQFITPSLANKLAQEIALVPRNHTKSTKLENGVIVNYRNEGKSDAPDAGMLDIFFIEQLIDISKINQDKLIQLLKNVTGQNVIYLRANAYINQDVKNTRIYHVDNTQPVIYKAFIYLSDAETISHGPYSFIKKSHRFSFYTYLTLLRNLFLKEFRSTDMPLYNKKQVFHATGKKGDLILSSQNGIHRGLPQEEEKKRIVLVLNYMIKSKLSYLHKTAKANIKKDA